MKRCLWIGTLLFCNTALFSQVEMTSEVKFREVKLAKRTPALKAAVSGACGLDTVRYAANKAYYLQAGFNDPNTGGWSVNKLSVASNVVTTAYKVPAGGSVTVSGAEVLGIMLLTGYGSISTATSSQHTVYLYNVDVSNKPVGLPVDSAYVNFTNNFQSHTANFLGGPHIFTTDFAIGVRGGATSNPNHFLYVAHNLIQTLSASSNQYGEHLSYKYQAAAGGFIDMATNFGDPAYDFEFAVYPIVSYNFAVDFTPSLLTACGAEPITLTNTSTGTSIFKSHSFSLGAFAKRYNVAQTGPSGLPRDSLFYWYTGINTTEGTSNVGTTAFTTQATPGTYNDTLFVVSLTHDYNYCFQKQIIPYSVLLTPVTPSFSIGSNLCAGTAAPLLPSNSANSITGSWSPATVSNTASGTYAFTPDVGQCATTTSATVTVNAIAIPDFAPIAPFCVGEIAPALATTSSNSVSGSWSPTTVSNSSSGTYTFTPNSGQCAANTSLTIVVTPASIPTFSLPSTICTGAAAPILETTSLNAITGTWTPSTASNTASDSYVFTPESGQCAASITSSITVSTGSVTPLFSFASSICSGATGLVLPTASSNSVTGTWTPSLVNNTATTTYAFTPTAGSCASSTTVTIIVNSNTVPSFTPIAAFCAGTAAPSLPASSLESIAGTWSPSLISNTTSGSYTFTPVNGSCSTPIALNVTVNPGSTPTFSLATTLCAGQNAPNLPSVSDNAIAGTWSPAWVSNTASNSYVFTPNGTGECATSVTLPILVNTIATPSFTAISPFCLGATAPLLPAASNNAITGTWYPSIINNLSTGVYTFTPTAGSCASTYSTTVIVTPNLVPSFSLPNTLCVGATAPLLPTSSVESIPGTWAPSMVSNTTTGAYVFTPSNGVCATSIVQNIVVNPVVIPSFSFNSIICVGAAAPQLSLFSDNGVMGSWSPAIVSNTANGTYLFTPNNGLCSSLLALNFTVQECAGVTEVEEDALSIFPNPTNDYFIVSGWSKAISNLLFYATDGKLIENRAVSESALESFDVRSLSPGVYFFVVGESIQKVIVQ
jgi:hypothetical protein